ncbi:uronyl 2-sulfotransferase-like [Ptychodera flava]|uniref:uronyl 2-sulfotransferase-like n=1 Tax=Ptychodera flava TaxID=63121 RepID=UPI003969D6E2
MLMIRIGRIFISPARLILIVGTLLFFAVVFKLTSQHIGPGSSSLLDTSLRFDGESALSPDMGLPLDPTGAWNETRVIFNRVSKVGSRSLLNVIMRLSQKLEFKRERSPVFVKVFLNETGEKIFIKEIEALEPPYIYDRHLDYVDFETYGSAVKPVWINLTRDPVSRLVSFYYYTRFGDSFSVPEWTGAPEDFNQTFDECVLNNKYECSTENTFRVVPYFCGQKDECRTPSRWAIEQAKKNVVEKFLFVGITEQFNSTLVILERLLPKFFEGALEAYKVTLSSIRDQFKSKSKIEPSEEALKIQRERMALEVEFYEFVKKRMLLIKEQLGIPENPM